MPTEYKRKASLTRGRWPTDQLYKAIDAIDNQNMGIREASHVYGVPEATSQRRRINMVFHTKNLGPSSIIRFF